MLRFSLKRGFLIKSMCGRFIQTNKSKQIDKKFKVNTAQDSFLKPRYNIAPTQTIPAVLETGGERIISGLKWGLIPHWSKDDTFAAKLINARAESIAEKPSFRDAFTNRRCIIPASGFYEWDKKSSGAKQPFYFYLKEKEVFGFAGLWEEWLDKASGELVETCTIITTEANRVLEPVHDRMPVILKSKDYEQWLDEKQADTNKLQNLLVPYPAKEMASHAVGKAVNSPSNDSSELINSL